MAWLRRWWWLGIPVVPIVLGLLTGITIRLMGQADLAAVRREIAASGQPADYAAWRATIPPADAERGDALRQVIDDLRTVDFAKRHDALRSASLAAARAFASTKATPIHTAHSTEQVARAQVELDAVMQAAAGPLEQLHAHLSGLPAVPLTRTWSLPAYPEAAQGWFKDSGNSISSDTRQVAHALAMSVARAEDPTTGLTTLRALGRAARSGPLMIDAMVAMDMQPIIDAAHWAECLRGREKLADLRGWLDDLPDYPESIRLSLIGERIVMTGIIWDAPSLPTPPWWVRMDRWITGPGSDADLQRAMLDISSTTAVLPLPPSRLPSPFMSFSSVIAGQFQISKESALAADAHARIYRIAALILLHANHEPDAAIEARIRPLLVGAPGRVRLGWERLPDRRIRVGVDPGMGQPVALGRFQQVTALGLGSPLNPTADPDRVANGTLEFPLP